MTPEQLKEKVKQLTAKFESDKFELCKEYAISHNPFKEGDIVTDSVGSILIDTIQYTKISSTGALPECVYGGLELKKDKTPRKDGSRRRVYQSQVFETKA